MKSNNWQTALAAFAVLALMPAAGRCAAEAQDRVADARQKIEEMRGEMSKVRTQTVPTMAQLKRLTAEGVDSRSEYEKFKGELAKMEEQAVIARNRVSVMKANGMENFSAWEKDIQSMSNPEIRKAAVKRYEARRKSYERILGAIQEAGGHLAPFMSDLNDIRTLLDRELTKTTVNDVKGTIRSADRHGEELRNSLSEVESELERLLTDLAKYK